MAYTNNQKGFTILELMVALAIVGILSTIAVVQYKKVVLRAKISEAQIYIKHLQELEDAYYIANGVLPHQDGTMLFVVDTDASNSPFGGSAWWKSLTDRTSLRLREMGVQRPGGKSRFWYYFVWWGGVNATKIIYAYPKREHDIFNFPKDECDKSLERVTLAIDNDGSIYVWGVPGMR